VGRSRPDSEAFALQLRRSGFPPVLSPLTLKLDTPPSTTPDSGQDLQREPFTTGSCSPMVACMTTLDSKTAWKR